VSRLSCVAEPVPRPHVNDCAKLLGAQVAPLRREELVDAHDVALAKHRLARAAHGARGASAATTRLTDGGVAVRDGRDGLHARRAVLREAVAHAPPEAQLGALVRAPRAEALADPPLVRAQLPQPRAVTSQDGEIVCEGSRGRVMWYRRCDKACTGKNKLESIRVVREPPHPAPQHCVCARHLQLTVERLVVSSAVRHNSKRSVLLARKRVPSSVPPRRASGLGLVPPLRAGVVPHARAQGLVWVRHAQGIECDDRRQDLHCPR